MYLYTQVQLVESFEVSFLSWQKLTQIADSHMIYFVPVTVVNSICFSSAKGRIAGDVSLNKIISSIQEHRVVLEVLADVKQTNDPKVKD